MKDFPQAMIICLGEILVDRIAVDVGQDVTAVQEWMDLPGGAPANVSCALRRLETNSAFLGAVGNDEAGDRLLATLTEYGVNLDLVQRCDAPTRQVYVTRTLEGDREFAGFGSLGNDAFADTKLKYHRQAIAYFQRAKVFYLGTLVLAEEACREVVDHYLQLAQSLNIPCFMDVNWRPMFWGNPEIAKQIILERLHQVRFLKLSEEEVMWLFESQSPRGICDRFPQLHGIFVTSGERGCKYWFKGFAGTVPGFEVSVIDTTGAGDGFVAGCLHQLANGDDAQTETEAEQFVRYANAVGALTTMHLGAIAPRPTTDDVLKFLKYHDDMDFEVAPSGDIEPIWDL